MMSSPGLCRESPSSSSGLEVTSNFDNLWTQLKKCHDNALKELQTKVKWLKKKRCLDAQILEGLFNRNQLLQKQNKALQDTVTALEERLRAGLCDCCTVTDEYMKKKQVVFEVADRDCPQEKRQHMKELEGLKKSCCSGEQEGVIPDSPLKHISMPVVRKMRRRIKTHVRYSEEHLPQTQSTAINGEREKENILSSQSPKQGLLVPETCEMETTQAPQCCSQSTENSVVTETCCLDFSDLLASSEFAANAKTSLVVGKSLVSSTQPGTTESPSLLHTPTLSSTRKQILCHGEKPNCCAWEKKSPRNKTETGTITPVEPMWSLDSKLSLSQYNIDTPTTVERQPCEEMETVDMDCTFVSHSLLLHGLSHNGKDISTVPGIGQKANNSLAEVFDQETFGEYESCPQNNDSHHHEEKEQGEENEAQKHQNMPLMRNGVHKDSPTFAHVAVVRNREERRKLQGHTCKECEMYYADLPEAERQKKLSSCSRHRFRYVPPSTPENFWEVGFPSTQTCVKRGYIKEDNEPEQRIRRKRPYNVIFSPKLRKKDFDQ